MLPVVPLAEAWPPRAVHTAGAVGVEHLKYGMYPMLSRVIDQPSGVLRVGVAENGSHRKRYPNSWHRYPTERIAGVDGRTSA